MKALLDNKTDFDVLVGVYTGDHRDYHGNVVSRLEEPEKYPCVLIWDIEVDDNGPDYLDGDYVYLDDFNDIETNGEELIDRAIEWFNSIADDMTRVTTGNLSHQSASIRGRAIRAAEFLEKHKNDGIKEVRP